MESEVVYRGVHGRHPDLTKLIQYVLDGKFKRIYYDISLNGGGGGVGGSGQSLWKKDFELGVEGEGQDTSRHFEASEKKMGQKPKSKQKLFGGLNQKSAMISMCKIHIYIDSESFRQIH